MPANEIDFKEFAGTKISLFLFSPVLRQHFTIILKHLGFEDVTDHDVPRNYFEALKRLISIIPGESEVILLNLPPKPTPAGKKGDVDPIFEQINAAYLDIKTSLSKRSSDPLKLLSKTIPVLEVGDYLRDKLVEVLFRYRVPAAFFMSAVNPTGHLKGARKSQAARENLETHIGELTTYLNQYFRDKDEIVAMADEKLSEKELSERKKKYDDLMIQAEACKERRDYETAINLLRQAIEVFPRDIEAYLESGRLYVRRREYGRALSRFSQAEDLFQDAPSPNKEIASVRLTQVKEKIEAGADPNSPEILELMNEAVANFAEAHEKALEMDRKHAGDPDFEQPLVVGQEILKWNMSDILGAKHPAVKALMDVAEKSTEGLDKLPVDQLTTSQCLTLGLQALESGDVAKAARYYFRAIRDQNRFTEVCTEINYVGIRLRNMGKIEDALKIYNRLLKHKPHNQGSVYWNMAIAFAHKDDPMQAVGYATRCLYTDPYMSKEKEFYDSLTPKLAQIMMRLIKALRLILSQQKKIKQNDQLKKLYGAREKLIQLIHEGKKPDALKMYLTIFKQASKFTVRPEFYGDGVIPEFLVDVKSILEKNPKQQATVRTINGYLKYVSEHKLPPQLSHFFKLTHAAQQAVAQDADQHKAAYYLGQAIIVAPASYFARPDFFSRDTLPALVREIAGKFQYVDVKKFPQSAKPVKAQAQRKAS